MTLGVQVSMLTVVCSGPARNRGVFAQAVVAAGGVMLREEDRHLGGMPDWPEDAAQVAAQLRDTGDDATASAWERIAESRVDVDVDWIEAQLPEACLDDVQGAAPRWGWLVRMYGPAPEPSEPPPPPSNVDTLAAAVERRILDRLRAEGVIE